MSLITLRNKSSRYNFDHTNIFIINCSFYNWGTKPKKTKITNFHAVYLKHSDAYVENCVFHNINSGSAISIRNSGIIRNNYIIKNAFGLAGIAYWNQFPASGSKKLIIEGNTIIEKAFDPTVGTIEVNSENIKTGSVQGAIYIASNKEDGINNIVDSILIVNNKIIILNGVENEDYGAIGFHKIFKDDDAKRIYIDVSGNSIIDLRNLPVPIIRPEVIDNHDWKSKNKLTYVLDDVDRIKINNSQAKKGWKSNKVPAK